MKLIKISKKLSAVLLTAAFVFTSCTGISSEPQETQTEEKENIEISAENTSATIEDIIKLSIKFSNFETAPTAVDVFVEESDKAITEGISVKDGKIELDTSDFEAGSYKLYVKIGSVKSNSLEVRLAENPFPAPKNITVTASSTTNCVKVKWTDTGASTYWIYYNTENDSSTATCVTKYGYRGSYGYEVLLSTSGTYYFWVKAADGTSKDSKTSNFSKEASYDFTYTSLSTPTGLEVTASSTTNCVKVKWTDTGASTYWIYYNTENDSSTATCATKYGSRGSYGEDILLSTSGTYYFWVKAADGTSKDSVTSDFSEVASYSFTYTSLSAPTNIKVTASYTTNYVKVKWTNTGASTYWIYYNTENDSSTATCATKYGSSGSYGYELLLSTSGTYYFWVKAADGDSDDSTTSDFSEATSYSFTYTSLSAPTNVEITDSSTTNYVKVKWTNTGAANYWIYYNTENDSSTATCATKYGSSGSYGEDVLLSTSGTYYFWVKAADGTSKNSATSDFSEVATFDFSN